MIDLTELQEYVSLCARIATERERVCRLISTIDTFQKDCFKDLQEIEKGNHPQEYRSRFFDFPLAEFLDLHKRRVELEKSMTASGLGALIVKTPPATLPVNK